MTQTSLETSPSSLHATLVTFTWSTHTQRYCRWVEDLDVGDDRFYHAPELSVVLEKAIDGGTEDSPAKITLLANRTPVNRLVQPFPHAKVRVLIEEVVPGASETRREIFWGMVDEVELRRNKQARLATLEVKGIKARLTNVLGLQATSTCQWVFGDRDNSPCKITLDDKEVAGTITELAVDDEPNRVKITGISDQANLRWSNGILTVDGARVKIREALGDDVFDLARVPPPWWLDASCLLTPGCDRTLTNCRFWDNEDRFMGIGRGMPTYSPTLQTG